MADKKTNAMRTLDSKKIHFTPHEYGGGALSATEVAAACGIDPMKIYKTLVTVGKSGEHYVFVVPGPGELNLKKAAKAAGEKSIEMIKQKDLLPLTGYVHGGCSPIGMKKYFQTFVNDTAQSLDTIVISAGAIGHQIEISPEDLKKAVRFEFADVADLGE